MIVQVFLTLERQAQKVGDKTLEFGCNLGIEWYLKCFFDLWRFTKIGKVIDIQAHVNWRVIWNDVSVVDALWVFEFLKS